MKLETAKQLSIKTILLSTLFIPATVILLGLLSANGGCSANQICLPDSATHGAQLLLAVAIGVLASFAAVWLHSAEDKYPETQNIIIE